VRMDQIWTLAELGSYHTKKCRGDTMSQPETTGPVGNLHGHQLPGGSLSSLIEMAREAYQQKRTKDCLDLTRALLLIDPENSEAQLLRSSIRSEMHQDLENARALRRHAPSKDEPEIPSQESLSTKDLIPSPEPAAVAAPNEETFIAPLSTKTVDMPIRLRKPQWLKRSIGIAMFGLVVAGLPLLRSKSNPIEQPLTLRAANGSVSLPDPNKDTIRTDSLLPAAPVEVTAVSTTPSVERPPIADRPSTTVSPAPRPVPKLRDQPSVAVANGTLAVSSPVSVDIFKDDAYLGSAPVTLELPGGTQTLEYRHGNLHKKLTHLINSNQTTKAMITFEVNVQINSRPWAEVFLDGSDRKPLGQTPLSGVQVPIGGVLIFENPQFQSKRYRVTGNESGIQIVFP
jgi:hypothetical protein